MQGLPLNASGSVTALSPKVWPVRWGTPSAANAAKQKAQIRHTSELQSHSHLVCRDWSSDVCRSEEHTSELQSHSHLVCRLLLEKKENKLSVVAMRAEGMGHAMQPVGAHANHVFDKHQHPPPPLPPHDRTVHPAFFFFKGGGTHQDLPSSPTRLSPD